MRRPWLVFGLLFCAFLPAHAGHSPPKIMLRIYVQTNEGLPPSEAQPVAIPPNGETIQIRILPEVTEGELTAAETDPSGALHLHFDHIGQVGLDAVTAQNQGRILVVMLNGYVIYAPVIDEELSTGELVIPHAFNPAVVQLLQETAAHNLKEAKRT